MRRAALAMLSALFLSGCVSMIDNAYDEQSRRQCDESSRPSDCYDRVDQHRRERDRARND
jgi:PBP1b-binding outer membrane lipoprotein LpoB